MIEKMIYLTLEQFKKKYIYNSQKNQKMGILKLIIKLLKFKSNSLSISKLYF